MPVFIDSRGGSSTSSPSLSGGVTQGQFSLLQSQVNTLQINTSNTTTNLQQQINQLAGGAHVVFQEQFVGNGVTTTFQLSGGIVNAQFVQGNWNVANVLNTLDSSITDQNGKQIYNAGILSIFTRTRLKIDNIDVFGTVTLNAAPQNGATFYITYWYNLSESDRLNNYYRDDVISELENESGDIATAISSNPVNYTNILSSTDTNVQLALDSIDRNAVHYTTLASISGTLYQFTDAVQDQINALSLNALSDVTVSTPASGDFIFYNGIYWENRSFFNIPQISVRFNSYDSTLSAYQTFNSQVANITASHASRLSNIETAGTSQGNAIVSLQTFNSQVAGVTGSFGSRLTTLETSGLSEANAITALQTFNSQVTGVTANANTRLNNHDTNLLTFQTFNSQVTSVTASQAAKNVSQDASIVALQTFNSQVADTSGSSSSNVNNTVNALQTFNAQSASVSGNHEARISLLESSTGVTPPTDLVYTYSSGVLVSISGNYGTQSFNYNGEGTLTSISGTGVYDTKAFVYDINGNLVYIDII